MVMFKPGDKVRVTDHWWDCCVRPGEYIDDRSHAVREFVVRTHNPDTYKERGGSVILVGGWGMSWYGEVFEHVSGPW